MFKRSLLIILFLVVFTMGCQPAEPETVQVPVDVEVTRIIEVPVEVTKEVEVLVEQIVPEMPSLNPMLPVELDSIESSITGREYTVTVVLPMSYNMSDASYPVVYVTDGDFYAVPLGMAAAQMAFGKEVPEFITVGVDYGNPNPMEWLELRELDMGLEGSGQYLQFFEEELIPHIESTYRVDSALRTLAGHSSGGNFALYSFLNGADTFDNFIASSPGLVGEFVDNVETFAANQGETTNQLYLSVGDLDSEATIAGVKAFEDVLVKMEFEGMDHAVRILDNETHLSARPRAFNSGMKWIFGEEAADPLTTRTTQEVFDSHQEAVETLDIEMLMADYAEDASLVTLGGALNGKEAILTGFFQATLEQFPDMKVVYDQIVCEGDVCLLQWSGESSNGNIPVGIGVLFIQDGQIQHQVEWFEVAPNK